MKHSKLVLSLISGVFLFLLLSAVGKSSEESNQYHITYVYGMGVLVYNSVSGEYKLTTDKELKKENNIKKLLEKE